MAKNLKIHKILNCLKSMYDCANVTQRGVLEESYFSFSVVDPNPDPGFWPNLDPDPG